MCGWIPVALQATNLLRLPNTQGSRAYTATLGCSPYALRAKAIASYTPLPIPPPVHLPLLVNTC